MPHKKRYGQLIWRVRQACSEIIGNVLGYRGAEAKHFDEAIPVSICVWPMVPASGKRAVCGTTRSVHTNYIEVLRPIVRIFDFSPCGMPTFLMAQVQDSMWNIKVLPMRKRGAF